METDQYKHNLTVLRKWNAKEDKHISDLQWEDGKKLETTTELLKNLHDKYLNGKTKTKKLF